ncbi:fluoride efflux transporter CrcB [Thalassotalea ponticola]|uniref:fluoride efflux transporter CrcB n=1 Tax=Thalassotalea ponticola TaxID=1523392 RepID=UPI0025B55A58|nr:fluoride efflux transporter CrcB [Thalassotalea ponticola]MDN3651455.1 fluoride efflux transporter CrcB [Thalassotalea ponticola]
MTSWQTYAYVALGGAAGASLRFFISHICLIWLQKGFPFATLLVNITGSLLMGILYGLIEQGVITVAAARILIGIGFLGAFTTFSTFSLDTVLLIQQGFLVKAMANVLLNVILCIVAAAIGLFLVTNR